MGLTAYYLPMPPDQVATHFGPDGKANGWHNHADFIKVVIVCIAIPAAILLSGELLNRLPNIKIPNGRYWLAPERRDDTVGFVRGWLRWLAVLILGLVALVIDMELRANLIPDYAPWVLAVGALLIASMIIVLVWRFRVSTD